MSKPEKRQRSADSRPAQKLKAQTLRLKSTMLTDPRSVSDFLRLSNGKLPSTNSQNLKKKQKKQCKTLNTMANNNTVALTGNLKLG